MKEKNEGGGREVTITLFGRGQWTATSNRPGRRRAGSIRSGLEVAARIHKPTSWPSTPSNSVSSWLTTRSVTPVLSWPRLKWCKSRTINRLKEESFTIKTSQAIPKRLMVRLESVFNKSIRLSNASSSISDGRRRTGRLSVLNAAGGLIWASFWSFVKYQVKQRCVREINIIAR